MLLLAGLLLAPAMASADLETPSPKPLRVLFVGNSYIFYYSMPQVIAQFAKSQRGSAPLEIGQVTPGGATLESHWDDGEVDRLLEAQDWDYVVLQEQSTRPIDDPDLMDEYARKLHREIKRHGAKTVFFLSWARQAYPKQQADLTEAYTDIAHELHALIAPIGPAWTDVRKKHPGLTLYDADGSHPSPAGSYLAACVLFAVLYHRSPVGLPAKVVDIRLSAEHAKILQDAAWSAVQKSR